MATLLEQLTLNGNETPGGTLALQPVNASTTLPSPTYSTGPGPGLQALIFSPSTYLILPYNAQIAPSVNNSISFGCWFNATASPSDVQILSTNAGGGGGFEIQTYSGGTGVNVNVWSGGSRLAYTSTTTGFNCFNTWAHVWCQYDSSTTTLSTFLNGTRTFQNNSGFPLGSGASFASTNGWRINGGRVSGFSGYIADVRFYNGVQPDFVSPPFGGGAITNASTSGSSDGAIAAVTFSFTPFIAPLSYTWTASSGGTTIADTTLGAKSGLVAATYTLTVKDSSATPQTITNQYVVNVRSTLSGGAITNATASDMYDGAIAAVTVSSYGSLVAPYTYAWTASTGGSTITDTTLNAKSNLAPATYTLTITDSSASPQTSTSTYVVGSNANLLERVSMNGSIAAKGSLAIAPTTTLGSLNYVPGPFTNSQGLTITGGLLKLAYSASLNFKNSASFSFGVWVNFTPQSGTIIGILSDALGTTLAGISLIDRPGSPGGIMTLYNNGTDIQEYQTQRAISNNSWTHFWVTYNSTTAAMAMYQNGSSLNYASGTAAATSFASDGTAGWQLSGFNSSITGAVADLRFYDAIVAPAKVMQLATFSGGNITNNTTIGGSIGAISAVTISNNSLAYPVTYAWTSSSGATTITTQDLTAKSSLSAGTYTLTLTDSSSPAQQASNTYVVTQPPPLVVVPGTVTNNTVNGASAGAISATSATGGSDSTYSYSWTSSTGASTITTQNASAKSGLLSGTYTVKVTDSHAESATYSYVLVDPPPSLLQQQYTFNGSLTSTGTLALALASPTSTLGGAPSYTTGPITGTQAVIIPSAAYLQLPFNSTLNESLTVNVSCGGWFKVLDPGNFIFIYANTGGSRGYEAALNASFNGQTYTTGGTVNTPASAAVVKTSWHHYWTTFSNGVISVYTDGVLTGTATTSSEFVGSQPWTLNRTGRYTATTSSVAAYDMRWYNGVVQPSMALITITGGTVTNNTAVSGGSAGAIAAPTVSGGSGSGYTYVWTATTSSTLSQGLVAQSGLLSGSYTLTVKDDSNTIASTTFAVYDPPIIAGGVVTNNTVTGGSAGAISAPTVSGGTGMGYTYTWTGTTSSTLTQALTAQSGLKAGTYTLKVVDSGNSTVSKSFTVMDGIIITAGTVVNNTVTGGAAGSISAPTVTGGSGVGYTYLWTGTTSSALTQGLVSQSGLTSGTYTLKVTDSNSTTASQSFTVYDPIVVAGGAVTNNTVTGGSSGAISATTVTGGSGTGFTYVWTGTTSSTLTQSSSAQTGLKSGTYTLQVTDSVSNSLTKTYNVYDPIVISGGTVTNNTVTAGASGAISKPTVSGGSGSGLVYTWTGPSTLTQALSAQSGLTSGSYRLTVLDGAGITATKSFTVFDPLAVTGGAIVVPVNSGATANGSISALIVSGGLAPYFYSWSSSTGATSPLAQDNSAKTNLKVGTYTCVITDSTFPTANSITVSYTVVVAAVTVTPPTIVGNTIGAVSITSASGDPVTAVYTSATNGTTQISLLPTNQPKSGLSNGVYVLNASTPYVSTTQTYTVTTSNVNPIRILGGTVTQISSAGGTGSIDAIVALNGVPPYSIAWSSTGSFITTQDLTAKTGLSQGQYMLTITDFAATPSKFTQQFIIVPYIPPLTAGDAQVFPVPVFGLGGGAISVTSPSGGVPPYSFRWTGGVIPDGTVTSITPKQGLLPGDYKLTITDSVNSTVSQTYTVVRASSTSIAHAIFTQNSS
jgi:hypothetical protein